MADNIQQTQEKLLSNDILKDVFQELHDTVVDNIRTSSVIDKLFSAEVISNNDMHELEFISEPLRQCRRLLIILHKAKNPRTFIELRKAITTEESYSWLVEMIDKKYNLQESTAVQPQVNQVRSNPLLTPLNGDTSDVTELNRVIDDLRRDNAILTTKNRKLLADNSRVLEENRKLLEDNSRVLKDNKRLVDDNKRLCLERSEYENKMVKIIDELENELESFRKSQMKSGVFNESTHTSMLPVTPTVTDNPQLLFTLYQSPTYDGHPHQVIGVAMLDKYLCVVYDRYDKVHVFDCEDGFKKIKEIGDRMRFPCDMVGCSVTSQLFISECFVGIIQRVNVNTGVSGAFIQYGFKNARLSLVENRLLVTSRDLMLIFDVHSGLQKKYIPFTGDMQKYGVYHVIESNRDSFFVCHRQSKSRKRTVSEIDSEGRVIRVFDNKEKLNCIHLELDPVGRLLVADYNCSVVLLDEHLQFIKVLLDKERLADVRPQRLSYDKNNNRLTVGLNNGYVKIFDCHM